MLPNRRIPVAGGLVLVFDNLFDEDTIINFSHVVTSLPFERKESFDGELNYGIDRNSFIAAPFLFEATEEIVAKFKPDLFSEGQKVNQLSHVYAAAIDTRCHTQIHSDQPCMDCVTFLYYANSFWNPSWGGETIFFNENQDSVACVLPKAGRLVLFNSGIDHRAGVPLRDASSFRYTVSAFYYCDKHNPAVDRSKVNRND